MEPKIEDITIKVCNECGRYFITEENYEMINNKILSYFQICRCGINNNIYRINLLKNNNLLK